MKMKKFDSMNVIPFIDIMLVLLTIVLTFSTFIAEGKIELKLPTATTATNKDTKFVEILIDKNNKIKLNSKEIAVDMLKQELLSFSKDSSVSLRADENTPFKTFVQVVDILKSLKLEKMSIITEMRND